jgi:hypothetical protein
MRERYSLLRETKYNRLTYRAPLTNSLLHHLSIRVELRVVWNDVWFELASNKKKK